MCEIRPKREIVVRVYQTRTTIAGVGRRVLAHWCASYAGMNGRVILM